MRSDNVPRPSENSLLLCPFCGSKAVFCSIKDKEVANFGGEFVECSDNSCCASSIIVFPTMADAKPMLIEKWNRRMSAAGVPGTVNLDPEGVDAWGSVKQPTPCPKCGAMP
jgi:hypothetical protein